MFGQTTKGNMIFKRVVSLLCVACSLKFGNEANFKNHACKILL